jgi:uncharacterized protein (TIGR02118 family)
MGKVTCICLVKAKPGKSREEFKERWLKGHTPFAASWKNIKGYNVFFTDPDIHKSTGEGLVFDGIGILEWDSAEEMQEDFGSEKGKAGFADAAEFMDCYINLYCEGNKIK